MGSGVSPARALAGEKICHRRAGARLLTLPPDSGTLPTPLAASDAVHCCPGPRLHGILKAKKILGGYQLQCVAPQLISLDCSQILDFAQLSRSLNKMPNFFSLNHPLLD